jgi:hypothetical protein
VIATQKTLLILAIVGLVVATYSNLQFREELAYRRGETARISQELERRLEQIRDDSISYSLEGRFLPLNHLMNRNSIFKQSARSPVNSPFSIVVVEAKKPCTPCFEMALDHLSHHEWTSKNYRVPIVIVSHRAHELRKNIARLFPLQALVLIDDPSGEIHSTLNLPEELTIAILSNGQGRILYARVVKSQDPHIFDLFVARVSRLLS